MATRGRKKGVNLLAGRALSYKLYPLTAIELASAIGKSIIDNSQYLYDKVMKIFKSEVKKQKTKQIKKSSRLEPKELKYKSYAARINGNNGFGRKDILAKAVKFRRKV